MDCLDCKICHVPYDEEDHRPRNSQCGHEICTACLKTLIKNGTFTCPKCRLISEINDPDDLPVSFGLIDVIRAFKSQNISSSQKSEVCYEHFKDIKHRCLKCKTWLCEECFLDQTRNHTGCDGTRFDIIPASCAISMAKERHTEDIRKLLNCFKEKFNYVASLIQGHVDKIQEITDMGEGIIKKAERQKKEILDHAVKQCQEIMEVAETDKIKLLGRTKKHSEEMEELYNLLEQGNKHNEKLVQWDNHLQLQYSSYRILDNAEMLTESKQLMKRWIQGLEAHSLIPVLKAVEKNEDVYFEVVTKCGKMYGKLSEHEENLYLNYFQKETLSDSFISVPFPLLHPMINEASLIFLELSIGDIAMGRMLVRLNKSTPNIRENMVAIVTGKSGKSLAGTELSSWGRNEMRTYRNLPFYDTRVNPDERIAEPEEMCNVVGYYGEGYLRIIYFSVIQRHIGGTGQYEIGHIESGIDILQECNDKILECHGTDSNCECKSQNGETCIYPSKRLKITDCGLVIERQE